MELEHGTIEAHLDTLRRAKSKSIDRVWTGDIRRNRYLAENLSFGQHVKIISLEFDDDREGQASYYNITWLKDEF